MFLIRAFASKSYGGEGVWRTINGSPVFIQNGKITKGPARLVGSNADDAESDKPKKESSTSDTKKSDSAGKNGKDLLPDYEDITEDEALDRLEKLGISNLEEAIEKQGFSGTPTVMNSQDFERYVKDGGIELSRGISAPDKETADWYVNELKNGEFYVAGGEAYFGGGMYAFGGDSLSNAQTYARGKGTVISMALPKDAKVLEVKGENGLRNPEVIKTFYKEIDSFNYGKPVKTLQHNKEHRLIEFERLITDLHSKDTVNFLKSKGYKLPSSPDIDLLYKDMGKFLSEQRKYEGAVKSAGIDYIRKTLPKKDAKLLVDSTKSSTGNNIISACRGYDAVKLSSDFVDANSSNGFSEIWIVLNRSKLVIKED